MKILPCPYCKSNRVELLNDGYTESSADNFWVSCGKCWSWGPWKPSIKKAINAWNKVSKKIYEN